MIDPTSTDRTDLIAKLNYRFLVLVREAVLLHDDDPEVAYGITPELCEILTKASHDALMMIAKKTADRGVFLFGLRDISPRQGEQWWVDLIEAAIENNKETVGMLTIHGSVLSNMPNIQKPGVSNKKNGTNFPKPKS